jgi:hypothetical protein
MTIFNLKNNYGYSDRKDLLFSADNTIELTVKERKNGKEKSKR